MKFEVEKLKCIFLKHTQIFVLFTTLKKYFSLVLKIVSGLRKIHEHLIQDLITYTILFVQWIEGLLNVFFFSLNFRLLCFPDKDNTRMTVFCVV